MPNGRPGDHPLTDLLKHGREVYGPEIDSALREMAELGEPGELDSWWQAHLARESNTSSHLVQVRARLAELRKADGGWSAFAATADAELDAFLAAWPRWQELVAATGGDRKIARVLAHLFHERAFDWLGSRPPVLDGRSGLECLETAAGRQLLRGVLMRFPEP
jgi:hypothetical protein